MVVDEKFSKFPPSARPAMANFAIGLPVPPPVRDNLSLSIDAWLL